MRFGRSYFAAYVLALTVTAAAPSALANTSGPLCTEALTVCAHAMQPLGVPLGGSFTVKIKDHFTATYECTMIDGQPRWAPTVQAGSCAAQPVIILPAKYEADVPDNMG
jgi:hypothetical protein